VRYRFAKKGLDSSSPFSFVSTYGTIETTVPSYADLLICIYDLVADLIETEQIYVGEEAFEGEMFSTSAYAVDALVRASYDPDHLLTNKIIRVLVLT
jgi:hypothetical protein